ncbi:MAG: universal stress protein UspA [Methylotenera sp.]|nr:MAG: universal stress protein UspA [Methylotenera sp.]
MYKNRLCPIDGSTTSNAGRNEAIHLANDLHARLRFIHIIDTYVPTPISSLHISSEFADDMARKNAKNLLHEAINAAKDQGVDADSRMIESNGIPISSLIIDYANEWPADLIVIGTHGLSGIDRFVVGSEAETVVRHSTVPVLLVKSKESD